MAEATKITLAGVAYEIKPLTLGQLEDLNVAIMLPQSNDPQEDTKRSYKRMLDVLSAALRGNNPELTQDALREMPISHAELNPAYIAVLELSGLIVRKPDQGEGSPAIKPA